MSCVGTPPIPGTNLKMVGMKIKKYRYERENVGIECKKLLVKMQKVPGMNVQIVGWNVKNYRYEDGYFGYEDQKLPVRRWIFWDRRL